MSGTRSDVRSDVRADARADEGVGGILYGMWFDGSTVGDMGDVSALELEDFDISFTSTRGTVGAIRAQFSMQSAAMSGQQCGVWLRWGAANKMEAYIVTGTNTMTLVSSAAFTDTGIPANVRLTKNGTDVNLYVDGVVVNGTLPSATMDYSSSAKRTNLAVYTLNTGPTYTGNKADGLIRDVVVKTFAGVLVAQWDGHGNTNADWKDSVNPGRTLVIPGTSGNYLSVPDASNLDGFGDFTVQAEDAILADWTPSSADNLLSKYKASSSWRSWTLSATSYLRITLSLDGSANTIYSSTVTHGIADGTKASVRAVRSGSDILFYKDVGSGWVKIGDTVSAVDTVLYDSPSQLEIGSYSGGASPIGGSITRARVWNNATQAGTPVFDVNAPVDAADGDVSFVATTGQTVTVNQTGTPSARVGGVNDVTISGSPSRAVSEDGGTTWAEES